jgi:hypothetical protein
MNDVPPWLQLEALRNRFNRALHYLSSQVLHGAGDGYDGSYEFCFPIGSLRWRIAAEPVVEGEELAKQYEFTVTADGHTPSEDELTMLLLCLEQGRYVDIRPTANGFIAIQNLP